MSTKYCGLRARTWLAAVVAVVALGALTVAADTMSHHTASGTP